MNSSVGNGRTPAAAAHVLLVGPVRNCAQTIVAEITRLRKVFSVFASVSWLLAESDSDDASLDQLRLLEREIPNFSFISMGKLRDRYPIRCDRIAQCRNAYIEIIKTDPRYQHIDYILSADLDGINKDLTGEAILTSWQTDVDWDGVMANQRLGYYDIWALRHKDWSPVDCWAAYEAIVNVVGPRQALRTCVSSKQVRLKPDAGLIEVDSACGGFGIYKRHAFITGRYVGVDANGKEVNEHPAFHADLRANGFHIYVNPAMINADFTEHTVHKTRLGYLRKEGMWTVREMADSMGIRPQLESVLNTVKRMLGRRSDQSLPG